MTLHRGITVCLLVCVVSAASVGCTTMKTIHPAKNPSGTSAFRNVKVGQEVIVETHDGRRDRVVVQRVESDAIVSRQGTRYAQKDIARIQRESFSPIKAAAWTLGTFAGLAILLSALLQA